MACKYFQSLGYKLIVVTNQSGIEEVIIKEDFNILTKWMLAEFNNKGINILDVFFCPHGPNSTCNCRKPLPGMFVQAHNKYFINIKDSY